MPAPQPRKMARPTWLPTAMFFFFFHSSFSCAKTNHAEEWMKYLTACMHNSCRVGAPFRPSASPSLGFLRHPANCLSSLTSLPRANCAFFLLPYRQVGMIMSPWVLSPCWASDRGRHTLGKKSASCHGDPRVPAQCPILFHPQGHQSKNYCSLYSCLG